MATIPSELTAVVNDFIVYFGQQETIELTNPGAELNSEPNLTALQSALNLASAWLSGEESVIRSAAGKIALRRQWKGYQLTWTRWRLDTYSRRESVTAEYEAMVDAIRSLREIDISTPVDNEELETLGLAPNTTGKLIRPGDRQFKRDDPKLAAYRNQRTYRGSL